jgi:thioredoxin reductase (NADPH)
MSQSDKAEVVDVCIIGSGPAAHTAAMYTSKANLKTTMFEGWFANGVAAGGHLTTTLLIETFPGFPQGIMGQDLCNLLRLQSLKCGTEIFTETVTKVDLSARPFEVIVGNGAYEQYILANSIIVATGTIAKRLTFPGSTEFWNKGISTCALSDGNSLLFRDQNVAVIGGGDGAMKEALHLTLYASKVYIVHRRDRLTAHISLQAKVLSHPKVEVLWNTEVIEAFGSNLLEGTKVKNNFIGDIEVLHVRGLFFAIGREAASQFLCGQVETDDNGYILTESNSATTSVEGVFAAGDVKDNKHRETIVAASSGCLAALEAIKYLETM